MHLIQRVRWESQAKQLTEECNRLRCSNDDYQSRSKQDHISTDELLKVIVYDQLEILRS